MLCKCMFLELFMQKQTMGLLPFNLKNHLGHTFLECCEIPVFYIYHGRSHQLPWCFYPFLDWLDFITELFPAPKKVNACSNPFMLSHLRISICTLCMWMKSWLNIIFLGHISFPLAVSRHRSTVLQPEMLSGEAWSSLLLFSVMRDLLFVSGCLKNFFLIIKI